MLIDFASSGSLGNGTDCGHSRADMAGDLILELHMHEVTKDQFREIYFRLGGGSTSGFDLSYWNRFFEPDPDPPMRYMVELPDTPRHDSMNIVTDYASGEYRLWFSTPEEVEARFDFPGKDT